MSSTKLSITLEQLKQLLELQKTLVVENLLDRTSYYNPESNDGCSKALNIDEDKFIEVGKSTNYPNQVTILQRYLED